MKNFKGECNILKVGDNVKILVNKIKLDEYDDLEFINLIINYKDEIYTIDEVYDYSQHSYKIKYNESYSYFKENELELVESEEKLKIKNNIKENDIVEIDVINNNDYKLFLKDLDKQVKIYQDDNLKVNIIYHTNTVLDKLTFTAFIEARN